MKHAVSNIHRGDVSDMLDAYTQICDLWPNPADRPEAAKKTSDRLERQIGKALGHT